MIGKRSERRLILGTKWILDFMFVSGVIVLLMSPFLLQYAGDHFAGSHPGTLYPVCGGLSDFRCDGTCDCILPQEDDEDCHKSGLFCR